MLQNSFDVNGCAALAPELARIQDALSSIDPDLPREEWWKILAGIKSELGEAGRDLALAWSQGGSSFEPGAFDDTWKSLMPGGGISIATVFFMAKEAGWNDTTPRPKLTAEQIKARQKAQEQAAKEAEAEAKAAQARTAEQAAAIWQQADPADSAHLYLKKKQAKPIETMRQMDVQELTRILGYTPKCKDGLLSGVTLVLPVRRVGSGDLSTLELIDGDGKKTALIGQGTKSRAYWSTVHPLPADLSDLLIGEGVATCLSAAEATGLPALASLTCSNLRAVAEDLNTIYPDAKITILADLDKKTGEPIPQAIEAAKAVGGFLAIPGFGPDRLEGQTDFNDLAVLAGLEAVRRCIEVGHQGESDWNREAGQRADMGGGEWPELGEIRYDPPKVPLFDANALLPEALRGWVMDEASRMPAPPEFVAAAAIVSLGALIGARCGIRPKEKDDWLIIPNLSGGVIGSPSEMKTPTIQKGFAMLNRLAANEDERHQSEKAKYEADMMLAGIEQSELKKRIEKAVKARSAGKNEGDPAALALEFQRRGQSLEESRPRKRRYLTNDCTEAKLGDLLVHNPAGLLIFRDELIGLLGTLDTPENQSLRGLVLEGFGGQGGYAIDRMERGELFVPNVCLSFFGSIQPDKLAAYMDRAFRQNGNDGLIQRFQMLVFPDPTGWKYIDRYPDKVSKDRAWNAFKILDEFDPVDWGATPPDDFCRFCRFGFKESAQKIFIEWLSDLQTMVTQEENPRLAEHFSKYRKLGPALALIFHLVECADTGECGPVSDRAMLRAAAWCDFLAAHARKAYGLLMDAGMVSAVALSKRILEGKLRSGFSARDVYVKGWSGLTDIERVKTAIDVLVNEGWLRPSTLATGGRKKEAYKINPLLGGDQ